MVIKNKENKCMSEYPNNPELAHEQRAEEIINYWKSQGHDKVHLNSTYGTISPGESSVRAVFDIDDPKVKEYIMTSLSRGQKYEINKE